MYYDELDHPRWIAIDDPIVQRKILKHVLQYHIVMKAEVSPSAWSHTAVRVFKITKITISPPSKRPGVAALRVQRRCSTAADCCC
mmetsp:Transcript_3453/g.5016  ORF Transcript_3453/g.5016 Transcript_3453/m.5016 type:complete len:85 (-) Transcript_3453:54-308(-)